MVGELGRTPTAESIRELAASLGFHEEWLVARKPGGRGPRQSQSFVNFRTGSQQPGTLTAGASTAVPETVHPVARTSIERREGFSGRFKDARTVTVAAEALSPYESALCRADFADLVANGISWRVGSVSHHGWQQHARRLSLNRTAQKGTRYWS